MVKVREKNEVNQTNTWKEQAASRRKRLETNASKKFHGCHHSSINKKLKAR